MILELDMKVIFAGDAALDIIKNTNKFYLLSQNSKAIYIRNNKSILSLQDVNTELSPISLLVDDRGVFEKKIRDNQEFIIKNKIIYIKDRPSWFSFDNTPSYNSQITENHDRKLLKKTLTRSKSLLKYKKTGGLNQVFFDKVDINFFIIDYLLENIKNIYKDSIYDEQKILDLHKFIGVGVGLTPSFDDFLCGFLSAGYFFGILKIDKLIELTEKNLDKTNEISRFFIKLAIDKKFSKAITDFYTYILDENIDFSKIRDQFYNIGSSSGVDGLFGIYFYCRLCQQISNRV